MIEFTHVTKRFPDGTLAVEDFSLVLPSRKTTVFVGLSGSGKTTLLRMINRMVEPTSGDVAIDGESVLGRDPVQLRRGIGYVMQNSGLLPHFSVIDNITTVLRLNGIRRVEAEGRALELMDTVGLERDLARRYPSQLSGGQQQRVGVARGLAADPNILLMDEPFGAVDPIVRADLQQELIRLQRDLDKTVVFVTHDIDEAFLLGDQVVILDKGARIVQVGSPSQIMEDPADAFVEAFIGAERGRRALTVKQTPRGAVVVDSEGRTQGILRDARDESPSRDEPRGQGGSLSPDGSGAQDPGSLSPSKRRSLEDGR
ncbi:ATP-binding cassette domain-containing protein [uncultured Microbacterium sp.]|uniref:ABC transporter ATP-binding protein n=1 Tax=uncultured Microbacterium sp. TaxID=191216 RepID=UPI0026162B3F|nr:ATP-binding cassette domain-containing protein [uncultured Microbacterium sp.]